MTVPSCFKDFSEGRYTNSRNAFSSGSVESDAKIDLGVTDNGLLGSGKKDAYGPGIHSDATGRPFFWETDTGQKYNGPVKENAYGLGVGMDQFGRPVRAKPW